MASRQTEEDLSSFVSRMGGDKALKVEELLGSGFVRLRVSEAERRQAAQDIRCSEDVVIEMLRNARDAHAHNIFVACSREDDRRIITMLDDGDGIPTDLWQRVFDARVTSKLKDVRSDKWGIHGRGMALYSISQNCLEATVMDSVVGGGTSIRVVTDTCSLPERADQSSWPTTTRDEDGLLAIERGPHNIIRTCCEFVLESHASCRVYLGSAAEIVATIRHRIKTSMSGSSLLFLETLNDLPVLERFRLASDASELVGISRHCGLDISDRTAHRILAGQIRPLQDVYARMAKKPISSRTTRQVDLQSDARGLKLSSDDREAFLALMERDFSYLAQRYYLSLTESPKIRVKGNRLSIVFEYEAQD